MRLRNKIHMVEITKASKEGRSTFFAPCPPRFISSLPVVAMAVVRAVETKGIMAFQPKKNFATKAKIVKGMTKSIPLSTAS